MKNTLRRLGAGLLMLLLAGSALPASAGHFTGEGHQLIVDDAIVMRLEKVDNWKIVTPDTLEDNMALLTRDGTSPDEVRRRFAQDGILVEAYHDALPDGVVRMQKFEDDRTRSVWNLANLNKKQRAALKQELTDRLFQGYLHLFNVKDNFKENAKKWRLWGSVIAHPPCAYESGYFCLRYLNGKAYLLSYVQHTPASNSKVLGGTHTVARVGSMTDVMHYVPPFTAKEETAAADLMHDQRLILNAHSGPYTFVGVSEKGASVTVETGGRKENAKVDGEGKYTARITLAPGDNAVVARAKKEKLAGNALTRMIPVNDGMAALELTDYPHDAVDRGKMKAAGRTSPGARVTVKIDGGKPEKVKVKKDGSFSWDVKAGDWTEHTIEITASEDGLTDCTAKFTFRPLYEDAAKGIQAFQKTLTKGVTGKKISASPGEYVGSRVKMEVYTTQAQRQDGRLILHANIGKDKNMPIILVCPDYLEDQIQDKMILTVYGTVIEPSRTEQAVPRLDVEYIRYRRTVYKRNPYHW